MFNKNQVAEFFATFFYIGKVKYCPGTFGSVAAFPLWYIIVHFIITSQVMSSFTLNTTPLIALFLITLIICLILFILGIYFVSIYVNYTKKEDPKEVVIDEVVGQMLTIILCSCAIIFINHSKLVEYLNLQKINFIFLLLLPFCLFRFCDIVKPWPINWLDKNIKGAVGIMLDDVAAAIVASVLHYTIVFTVIDWFG